jgi:cardiolipin synthase
MFKILGKIFSRVVLVSVGIALQLAWLFLIVFKMSEHYLPIAIVFNLISIIAVIWIINRPGNPTVKIAWIVPILVFPLFGGIIFILSGGKGPKKKLRRALDKTTRLTASSVKGNDAAEQTLLSSETPDVRQQCGYLEKHGFPYYVDSDAAYYDNGRDGWERMLEDLKRAEKFIFLEFFIIREGKMWNAILDILREKVNAGVEVRLMYDDVGSIGCVPHKYPREMEKLGIKCVAFNRYKPIYSVVMNNRDHRKILVIDGSVSWTGGSNLADEYIGELERFGEWKDNFVRLEGEAVRTMTVLFLQMWNAALQIAKRPTDGEEHIASYMPDPAHSASVHAEGIVQPYGDSPVDENIIGEDVYLNIINQANDYVYIFTPYLVIDYEMTRALSLAAQRGVDVRVVVPEIPDKKIVYELTKSYFPELIENGVKIYKFTPGFIHSKCFVADDRIAVVGTINLDYRSLIQHFENACLFVGHPVVGQVKADFDNTFPRCEEVQPRKKKYNVFYNSYLGILRLLAPLL